jgi:hypothetical protein
MKKFKTLMMAVLTISSASAFAQRSEQHRSNLSKQNSEKVKFTCSMHQDMVMDNLSICQDFRRSLNLSNKEKMKREVMKINGGSMSNEVRNGIACNLPKEITALNLSPKEKMKWESMRVNNSHLGSYVNTASTCSMMNVLANDKHIGCLYCCSPLNLSPKEKMKREAVKI